MKPIQTIINEVCHANGAQGLIIDWNSRLTTTMGRIYISGPKAGLIQLSSRLFQKATTEQKENTVAHEVAHWIGYKLHGTRGHDYYWANAMRVAGYTPTRLHDVKTPRRRQARVTLYCGCSEPIIVTQNKFTRWTNRGVLGSVRCKVCKEYVSLTKKERA